MSTGLDNRPTTVTEMGSQMDAGRHDLACSRPPPRKERAMEKP